jgi:trehalose 6-phosphate phosphatase
VRYLFGPGGAKHLATLVASDPLLAFDFDGTLAPLVEQPARAHMRPGTRRLLTRLARRQPVVIISGRSRADVEQRFTGVPLAGVTGNHGLEPWAELPELERLVTGWRERLKAELGHLPGVIIVDKHWSLTVDYRHAPDLEATSEAIHEACRRLPRARLLGGRHADLNIAPDGTVNKGTALRRYLAKFKRRTALYVGDDRTDEDIFRLDLDDLFKVRVGRRRAGSAARYFLQEQAEIDRLLTLLLDLGTAGRETRW